MSKSDLDAKNKEVVAERDRANTERDRAEAANKSLQQANDSIRSQYALIEQQKDSISHQKEEIAAERDNVKSANYAMQVNLSRILAEKASKLVDEGDSYLARLIALQGLPPHLPYTTDAEIALRKAASQLAKAEAAASESGMTEAARSLIADVKASVTRLEEASW